MHSIQTNLRILHLLDACVLGGAEKLVLAMLTLAAQKGLAFHFVTFNGGTLEKDFQECGANFRKIPRNSAVDWHTIRLLRQYVVQEKIQIIHTHSIIDSFYAQWACRGLPVRYIYTYHGYPFHESWKNRIARWITSSKVHKHVFVSAALANYFTPRIANKERMVVIENGIDLTLVRKETACTLRTELGIPQHSYLIGMVGNFVNTGRDQLSVCKAMKELVDAHVDVHCVFIGRASADHPQYLAQCQQYCLENALEHCVWFLGARKDVPAILTQLDAYVYASNHDSFGLTILEAMASAVPVFANDLPPIVAMTCHGTLATIHATKDYHQLAGQLRAFFANPEAQRRLAQEAAIYVEKNYSIDRVLNDYIQVYQDVWQRLG